MKNPRIKTNVIHSDKDTAWDIIGVTLGKKYKIAVVPYFPDAFLKNEAFLHAEFISYCFNNSDAICFLNKID